MKFQAYRKTAVFFICLMGTVLCGASVQAAGDRLLPVDARRAKALAQLELMTLVAGDQSADPEALTGDNRLGTDFPDLLAQLMKTIPAARLNTGEKTALSDADWERLKKQVLEDFSRFDPRMLLRGLYRLERQVEQTGPDARLFAQAARGWALLLMTRPAALWPEQADEWAASGLSCLALACRIDPAFQHSGASMVLAYATGYTGFAGSLSRKIGPEGVLSEDRAVQALITTDFQEMNSLMGDNPSLCVSILCMRLHRSFGGYETADRLSRMLLKQYPWHAESAWIRLAATPADSIFTDAVALAAAIDEQQQRGRFFIEEATWKEARDAFIKMIGDKDAVFPEKQIVSDVNPAEKTGIRLLTDSQVDSVYQTWIRDAVRLGGRAVLSRAGGGKAFTKGVNTHFGGVQPSWLYVSANTNGAPAWLEDSDLPFSALAAYYEDAQMPADMYTGFSHMTRNADNRPAHQLSVGHLLLSAGFATRAEAYLVEGGALCPTDAGGVIDQVVVAGGDDRVLQDAMKAWPNRYGLFLAAGAYYAGSDDQKAATALGHAMTLDPRQTDAAVQMARLAAKGGHLEMSEAVLNHFFVAAGAGSDRCRLTLAGIYLSAGDSAKTLSTLSKLNVPDSPEGLEMLSLCLIRMGDADSARAVILEGQKRYPHHMTWQTLALLLHAHQGGMASWAQEFCRHLDRVEARELADRVMKNWHPNSSIDYDRLAEVALPAEAAMVLGRFMIDRKRPDAAFQLLNRAEGVTRALNLEWMYTAYRALDTWKPSAASGWLNAHADPGKVMQLAARFYADGEWNAVIRILAASGASASEYADYGRLLTLMAWKSGGTLSAEAQEALVTGFSAQPAHIYKVAGQLLLGTGSESELEPYMQAAVSQCEGAYYLGLWNRLNGNISAAERWYRRSLETGLLQQPEWQFAHGDIKRLGSGL
ncbi:MAG: hypothetical protein CSA22_06600 [Deltaproteobacteria bacterium]|nr:MAG: hypothetical protein CSA22_06600 [Deltaproteobacteria bacterium]